MAACLHPEEMTTEGSILSQGFFEHPEYLAVRTHLPAPWQDILDLAYYSGWRKNEILGLTGTSPSRNVSANGAATCVTRWRAPSQPENDR